MFLFHRWYHIRLLLVGNVWFFQFYSRATMKDQWKFFEANWFDKMCRNCRDWTFFFCAENFEENKNLKKKFRKVEKATRLFDRRWKRFGRFSVFDFVLRYELIEWDEKQNRTRGKGKRKEKANRQVRRLQASFSDEKMKHELSAWCESVNWETTTDRRNEEQKKNKFQQGKRSPDDEF